MATPNFGQVSSTQILGVCRTLHRGRVGVSLIKIPYGINVADQPFPPTVRRFYWLRNGLHEPDDPEFERPGSFFSPRFREKT